MKTKISRKSLQTKLNHSISAFVKSISKADSKKIHKSVKKASKIVAKAIVKELNEINESKAITPALKKTISSKKVIAKHSKEKIEKHIVKRAHRVKKTTPVSIVQQEANISTTTPAISIEQEPVNG